MHKRYQTLLVETGTSVMQIALNRPEVHNAMNEQMISELTELYNAINTQSNLRCVVLKGSGKSFCAGADLNYMKEIAGFGFEENRRDGQKLAALFKAIYDCPVPTMAVVQGAAFGGANGLIAACDMVFAADDTQFAFSEVKLGIAPATIAPFVIKRIGEFGAKELMLTGKRFTAAEAEKWHLINRAVPAGRLQEEAERFINELNKAAPEAVKTTKKLIDTVINSKDIKALTAETATLIARLRASDEGQEGMSAFFEKRKPKWVK